MAFLLIGLLLVLGLVLLKHFQGLRKLKNFPPGPPRLPLMGSLPYIPGQLIHLHAERHWRRKYGAVVGLVAGPSQTMVMVCGAEESLAMLAQQHCQARPASDAVRKRSFGQRLGLMFSDGAYWTEQRRFTLRELRDLGLGKSKLGDVILDEAESTLAAVQRGGTVEPNKLFNAPVLNVLWYMVSAKPFARREGGDGADLDPRSKRLLHIMNRAMRNKRLATAPCDIWPALQYIAPEWSGYNEIYPPIFELQTFLRDEIKQQRQDEGANSLMSRYCEEIGTKPNYTEESLITTCLDLFMAGGESTANTLSFALMYMAMHPEKQAKVHAALDAAGRGPGDVITAADKPSLAYVEATLSEVMRINTIAPLAIPHSNSEEVEFCGYTIPKGTMILISLYAILHDEKHWGDPETFRPERFLDASGKYVKDPWMVQFGQGKRLCIGEHFAMDVAFLFFANLMNRFKYAFPAGAAPPSTIPQAGFTVCPQDYKVVATPRK